jgi:hypothetical protein
MSVDRFGEVYKAMYASTHVTPFLWLLFSFLCIILLSPVVPTYSSPQVLSHIERQCSALTIIGSSVLAFNSGLAIYNYWGDAGSVGFILSFSASSSCASQGRRNKAQAEGYGRLVATPTKG